MSADPLGDEFDAQDAAAAAASSQAAAAPSTPTPTPTPTPDPTPESASTDPSLATPAVDPAATQAAAAAAAPAAPQYAGARDYAMKARGFALANNYGDDAAFLDAMVQGHQTAQQRMAELQQLAAYGQLYLQTQAQQPPAGRPAAAAANDPLAAYKAPEFNPAWINMIEQTEGGGYKVRDGFDQAILPKFLAHRQWQHDFYQKLGTNPVEALKPMIAHVAEERAREIVQQQFGAQQQSHAINQVMDQISPWAHVRDAAGNVVVDPVSRYPLLTPAGQRYRQYVDYAIKRGVTDPVLQHEFAEGRTYKDFYQPQYQQQQVVAQGDAAKAALIQKMNRNPNASGSFVGPDNTGHTAPTQQNNTLSVEDMLRKALAPFPEQLSV